MLTREDVTEIKLRRYVAMVINGVSFGINAYKGWQTPILFVFLLFLPISDTSSFKLVLAKYNDRHYIVKLGSSFTSNLVANKLLPLFIIADLF